MSSDPSTTTGQYNATMGAAKEGLGNLIGAASLQKSGQEQQRRGQDEIEAARAKGYVEGTQDRLGGMKDATVGAITGDKQQQAEGNLRHDKGSVQQDLNSNIASS